MKNFPNKINRFLKHHIYELLFIGIFIGIAAINFTPGKILTGWDSIQTDLNPWLGVTRAFHSVWEEYQSFGLVAGNAHAADLPRALFIFLISYLIPQIYIRYAFHVFMLFLGGFGMMKLLELREFEKNNTWLAFLGGLFYSFNFGTIQIFFLPFEAFSIFFAAIPWMVYTLFASLRKPSRKNLILLLIVHLLFSSAFFIQTLFVVYCMILCGFLLTYLLSRSYKQIKTLALLFFLIIIANSYWIFPQAYFFTTSKSVVKDAKINQIATDDVYYLNHEHGDILSTFTMTGFYYDLHGINRKLLFESWQKQFFLNPAPYMFILLLFIGFIRKQDEEDRAITIMFIIAATIFLNDTPGFAQINILLRKNELFSQIFRTPFTKFILPFSFCYSYFVTYGISQLRKKMRIRYVALIASVSLLMVSFPVFRGHLFASDMKVAIPKDYTDVMNYFDTVDANKRTTLLPEYTYWGWYFNRWGYNGSGFIWYGLKQPTVSRTFDVWSRPSEQYFWEIKSAAEREDVQSFENVLSKYNINYIIYDKSLLPVSSTLRGVQYDRYDALFAKSPHLKTVYNGRNLQVLEYKPDVPLQKSISVLEKPANIAPKNLTMYEDQAYKAYGEYVSDPEKPTDIYYPFLNFNSQSHVTSQAWQLQETSTDFKLSANIPQKIVTYSVTNPQENDDVYFYYKTLSHAIVQTPQPTITGNTISLSIPKQLVYRFIPNETTLYNCSFYKNNNSAIRELYDITVISKNRSVACFGYDGFFLDQNYSYLVKISNKNIEGRNLFFYTLDNTKQQSVIEDRLTKETQYYIIPPRYKHGQGYKFVFQNNSYSNLISANKLETIEVYLIPYSSIESLMFKQDGTKEFPVDTIDASTVTKHSLYSYSATLSAHKNDSYVAFLQAFDPGWIAFADGKQLTGHVTINNWANGWKLDGKCLTPNAQCQITIIFWPQWLEYGGLTIAAATMIFLVIVNNRTLSRRSRAE